MRDHAQLSVERADADGTKPIAGKRREMMLRICEGRPDIAPPLYTIYQHVACDEIFQWLLDNKLTGEKFRLWLLNEYANSSLMMIAHVVKKITRDVKVRKQYAGKDFLAR